MSTAVANPQPSRHDRRAPAPPSPPTLLVPAGKRAHELEVAVVRGSIMQALRAKTPDEARRLLREQAPAIGLVITLGMARTFDGYDPEVVHSATAAKAAKLFRRARGFSPGAQVKIRQATDLSILAARDLLNLVRRQATPPNADALGRAIVALRYLEVVVRFVSEGDVRLRSRSVGDAIADEYEQAALAMYRSLNPPSRRAGPPPKPPTPEQNAAADEWIAARARRRRASR